MFKVRRFYRAYILKIRKEKKTKNYGTGKYASISPS